MCICACVCAVCLSALGDEVEGVHVVYAGHLLLEQGIIFDVSEPMIGVFFVLSLIWTFGEYVCMWVYVCIYAHTHTLHVGYSDVSPGVETRHLRARRIQMN